MTLVLGFDTSAAHCAAALVHDGRILAERSEPMARGQAERLFPLLEELLAGAETGWGELDRIGVGIGPGNFTGTRIAVAAARGLAMSLDIPALGVSGFEALAHALPRPVLTSIDGRGGRCYLQIFHASGPDTPFTWTGAPENLPPLPTGCTVTGHDADRIAALAGAAAAPAVSQPATPLAPAIATIALAAPADAPPPAPLYMRPADAAPPRHAAPVILA